jgi:regulator of sigma E protease
MVNVVACYLVAVFTLGALIAWHELGHWRSARWFRFDTPIFSIGLAGPVLFQFRWKETRFTVRSLLFGGYVNIPDLSPKGDAKAPAAWKRLIVLSAGPTMNLLLAVMILFLFNIPTGKHPVRVASFTDNSAALKAGLQQGDIIERINGETFFSGGILAAALDDARGSVKIDVLRGNVSLTVFVTKDAENHIGIFLANDDAVFVAVPIAEAASDAILATGIMFEIQARVYASLIGFHTLPPSIKPNLGGLIQLLEIISNNLALGPKAFILLVAEMNVCIAFMNLLPIPPMDGGRMMLVFVEIIRHRRLPEIFEARLMAAGAGIFVGLMAGTTIVDVCQLL